MANKLVEAAMSNPPDKTQKKEFKTGISSKYAPSKRVSIVERIDTTGYSVGKTRFPRERDIYNTNKAGDTIKKRTIRMGDALRNKSGTISTPTKTYNVKQ